MATLAFSPHATWTPQIEVPNSHRFLNGHVTLAR